MGKANRLMENVTAPGVGDLVRIEHHQVGGSWDPVVLHWHNYCEFELVTGGAGIHTLNNSAIPISRGSAFLCMLDDFHTLENNEGNILKLINIKFSEDLIQPDVLKKLYTIANHRYCHFQEEQLSRFLQSLSFFEELQTVDYSDKELKRALAESMLNQILILFLLQCPEADDEHSGDKEGYRIQKAIEYIHKNFKKNISEYDVATHVDLSINYFSTLFKKKTGSTFSAYIRELRLNYARDLIESKHSVKVSEIAGMAGFYSNSYFIRAFKHRFGITPKEMIIKEGQ